MVTAQLRTIMSSILRTGHVIHVIPFPLVHLYHWTYNSACCGTDTLKINSSFYLFLFDLPCIPCFPELYFVSPQDYS